MAQNPFSNGSNSRPRGSAFRPSEFTNPLNRERYEDAIRQDLRRKTQEERDFYEQQDEQIRVAKSIAEAQQEALEKQREDQEKAAKDAADYQKKMRNSIMEREAAITGRDTLVDAFGNRQYTTDDETYQKQQDDEAAERREEIKKKMDSDQKAGIELQEAKYNNAISQLTKQQEHMRESGYDAEEFDKDVESLPKTRAELIDNLNNAGAFENYIDSLPEDQQESAYAKIDAGEVSEEVLTGLKKTNPTAFVDYDKKQKRIEASAGQKERYDTLTKRIQDIEKEAGMLGPVGSTEDLRKQKAASIDEDRLELNKLIAKRDALLEVSEQENAQKLAEMEEIRSKLTEGGATAEEISRLREDEVNSRLSMLSAQKRQNETLNELNAQIEYATDRLNLEVKSYNESIEDQTPTTDGLPASRETKPGAAALDPETPGEGYGHYEQILSEPIRDTPSASPLVNTETPPRPLERFGMDLIDGDKTVATIEKDDENDRVVIVKDYSRLDDILADPRRKKNAKPVYLPLQGTRRTSAEVKSEIEGLKAEMEKRNNRLKETGNTSEEEMAEIQNLETQSMAKAVGDFSEGKISVDQLNSLARAARMPESGISLYDQYVYKPSLIEKEEAAKVQEIVKSSKVSEESFSISKSFKSLINTTPTAMTAGSISDGATLVRASKDKNPEALFNAGSFSEAKDEMIQQFTEFNEAAEKIYEENMEVFHESTSRMGLSDEDAAIWTMQQIYDAMPKRKQGAGETFVKVMNNLDEYAAFTGGLAKIDNFLPILELQYKLDNGKELTEQDLKLAEWWANQDQRDKDVWAHVIEIAAMMPGFIVEIASTGGASVAVRKGGEKLAGKLVGKKVRDVFRKEFAVRARNEAKRAFVKKMIDEGANKAAIAAVRKKAAIAAARKKAAISKMDLAEESLMNLPRHAVEAAIQNPLARGSHIVHDSIKDANIAEYSNAHPDIESFLRSPGKPVTQAILGAGFDNYVELFSEKLGAEIVKVGAFMKLPKAFQDKLAKLGLVKAFRRLNAGLSDTEIGGIMKRAEFHGVFTEVAEERVGDAIRALGYTATGGYIGEEFKWPTRKQWIAEIIAMSLPGGAATLVNEANLIKVDRSVKKEWEKATVFGEQNLKSNPADLADKYNEQRPDQETLTPAQMAAGQEMFGTNNLAEVDALIAEFEKSYAKAKGEGNTKALKVIGEQIRQMKAARGIAAAGSAGRSAVLAEQYTKQLAEAEARAQEAQANGDDAAFQQAQAEIEAINQEIEARRQIFSAPVQEQNPTPTVQPEGNQTTSTPENSASTESNNSQESEAANNPVDSSAPEAESTAPGATSATEPGTSPDATEAAEQARQERINNLKFYAEDAGVSEQEAQRLAEDYVNRNPEAKDAGVEGANLKFEIKKNAERIEALVKSAGGRPLQSDEVRRKAEEFVANNPESRGAEEVPAFLASLQNEDGTGIPPVVPKTKERKTAQSESTPVTSDESHARAKDSEFKFRDINTVTQKGKHYIRLIQAELKKLGPSFINSIVLYEATPGDGDSGMFFSIDENGIGRLYIDPNRLAENFNESKLLKGVSEEWIHSFVTSAVSREDAIAFWNAMPEKLKEKTQRSYYHALSNPPKVTTDTEKYQMFHEFMRMVLQEKGIKLRDGKVLIAEGSVTEFDISPTFAEQIVKMLKKIKKEFERAVKSLKGDLKNQMDTYIGRVDDLINEVNKASSNRDASNSQQTGGESVSPPRESSSSPSSANLMPTISALKENPVAAKPPGLDLIIGKIRESGKQPSTRLLQLLSDYDGQPTLSEFSGPAKSALRGVFVREGGMKPDQAASLLGFDSVDEMYEAIRQELNNAGASMQGLTPAQKDLVRRAKEAGLNIQDARDMAGAEGVAFNQKMTDVYLSAAPSIAPDQNTLTLSADPSFIGIPRTPLRAASTITPSQNAEYMSALGSGDIQKAQQMVDAAAKAAGYNVGPVFHGTDKTFDVFDTDTFGSWFATYKDTAENYAENKRMSSDTGELTDPENPRIQKSFLRLKNPFVVPDKIDMSQTTTSVEVLDAINEENGTSFTLDDLGYPADYEGMGFEFLGNGGDIFISKLKDAGFDGIIANELDELTYAAFNPNQIKSADFVTFDSNGNIIPLSERFDESESSVLRAAPTMPALQDDLGFYSGVESVITEKMPRRATPQQVMGILNPAKNPVKKAEVDWMGIEEWMEDKQRVEKDDVLDFVRANKVRFEEVERAQPLTPQQRLARNYETKFDEERGGWVAIDENGELARLGDYPGRPGGRASVIVTRNESDLADVIYDEEARFYDDNTKYSRYTIPGGENYREILLTLPPQDNFDPSKAKIQRNRLSVTQGSVSLSYDGRDLGTFQDDGSLADNYRKPESYWMQVIEETWRKGNHKGPNNIDQVSTNYSSQHWDDPNVVVHMRVDDRVDSEGNKVLFIQEIQSDWAGDINKKGARDDAEANRLESELAEKDKQVDSLVAEIDERRGLTIEVEEQGTRFVVSYPGYSQGSAYQGEFSSKLNAYLQAFEIQERLDKNAGRVANKKMLPVFDGFKADLNRLNNEINDLKVKLNGAKGGIPNMPYAKTYHELALKRLLLMATEKGYDKIALTTGKQQIDLYTENLRQNIQEIAWNKDDRGNINVRAIKESRTGEIVFNEDFIDGKLEGRGKSLDEVVGKNIADQIRNSEEVSGNIRGDNLSIGGHFHKLMYDQMIPTFLNKFAKKWGGKVSTSELGGRKKITQEMIDDAYARRDFEEGERLTEEMEQQELGTEMTRDKSADGEATLTQPSLEITPAMRESIQTQGVPLFAAPAFRDAPFQYNQIADRFLQYFPEDASIDEVEDGMSELPAAERNFYRALGREDWLGFDYPSQTIDAILTEPDSFELSTQIKTALGRYVNIVASNRVPLFAAPTIQPLQYSDIPMSATEVLYKDSEILPKPSKKRKNEKVAELLADVAEKHWGRKITSDDITPEEMETIIQIGVAEFEAAFNASGKSAANWYSTAIEAAMAVAGVIHPELVNAELASQAPGFQEAQNPADAADLVMRMALAITSQNLSVELNTRFAEEQFEIFKQTGKFDSSKVYGEKAESISGNLALANDLIQTLGFDGAREFVRQEFTARDLKKVTEKLLGRKVSITGKQEDSLNGAAIFGPKIGQGFLQNVMGNFTPVTIDLWMRRTWGRWTGDVVGSGATPTRLARLLDAARDYGLSLGPLKDIRAVDRKGKTGKVYRTVSDKVANRLETDFEFATDVLGVAREMETMGQTHYRLSRLPTTQKKLDDLASGDLSYKAFIRNQQTNKRNAEEAFEKARTSARKRGEIAFEKAKEAARKKGERAFENAKVDAEKKGEKLPKKSDFIKLPKKSDFIKLPKKSDFIKGWYAQKGFTAEIEKASKIKPDWSNAASTIVNALKPIDVPAPSDRRVISEIINEIRTRLLEKGYETTNADVQAVLWYPEKDLWAKLRGEEESNLKSSYDEQFIKIAKSRGLGAEAFAAAKSVESRRGGTSRSGGSSERRSEESNDQGTVSDGKVAEGDQDGVALRAAPTVTPGQDAAYMDAVQSGDMETAQRMVNEAARAAGYTIKGARIGFYVDGKALPPSNGDLNFVSGYFMAEGAGAPTKATWSVTTEINQASARQNDVKLEDIEQRSELVVAKADNILQLGGRGGQRLTPEETKLVRAEIDAQHAINDKYIKTKLFRKARPKNYDYFTDRVQEIAKARGSELVDASIHFSEAALKKNKGRIPESAYEEGSPAFKKALYILMRDGLIQYDAVRGIGGRASSGEMASEFVVPNRNQIKSAEPVTRDADGNVIPLSERFDEQSDSILRAAPTVTTTSKTPDPGNTIFDAALRSIARTVGNAKTVGDVKKFMAGLYAKPFAEPVRRVVNFLVKQGAPFHRLPQEVRSLMTELRSKQALGGERAMDVARSVKGNSKFSDLHMPPELANNKQKQKQLFMAMDKNWADKENAPKLEDFSEEIQDYAKQLREILIKTGEAAVAAGRMHPDTFLAMKEGYMPHYYYQHEKAKQKLGGIFLRMKLGIEDIMAQRQTMWRIEDQINKGQDGLPLLAEYENENGKKRPRFRSRQHRDAFYEEMILEKAANRIRLRSRVKIFSDDSKRMSHNVTPEDLKQPHKLTPELRGYFAAAEQELRQQYRKQDPLTLEQQEEAGLIMDPVYAVARHVAQMEHDNATAEFFNQINENPEWVSEEDRPGFVQLPTTRRLGRLSGKFVEEAIAEEITELVNVPETAARMYDGLLTLWKTGKTVYNPGTHVRNVMGNVLFAQFAGISPLDFRSYEYYKEAFLVIRNGGPLLEEMLENGVLGADFLTAELRKEIQQILPEDMWKSDDFMLKMSSVLSRAFKKMGGQKAQQFIENNYQLEDELFKAAAYIGAKDKGMDIQDAALHVRKWFPYYDDIGTSFFIKSVKRGPMPFFSFYRESIRILGNAAKERPFTLAASMALPAAISKVNAVAALPFFGVVYGLGLDDDEWAEIKDTSMRGKGRFLLRDEPLFSILLPVRNSEGKAQQWDLTNVMPFAALLGRKLEIDNGVPAWQQWTLEMISSSPITGIPLEMAFNKNTFTNKPIWEENMTDREKAGKAMDHVWTKSVPPLAPGGTGFKTLARSGKRRTDKSLETRDPLQSFLRAAAGFDLRSAAPNIYDLAENFRKQEGLPKPEFIQVGSTAVGRARKAVWEEVSQTDENRDNDRLVRNLAYLNSEDKPIRTKQDINRLLFFRNPLMVIEGEENQRKFRRSLTPESRKTLEKSLKDFDEISRRAGPIITRANRDVRRLELEQRR